MSNFLIKTLFVNEQPVSYRRFVSVNRNPFQRWSVQRSRSNRAGNGNRTRMASLEGWNFTIKLCPRG